MKSPHDTRRCFFCAALLAFFLGLGPWPSARADGVTGSVWKPVGPASIREAGCCYPVSFDASGRVNSIAVDPNNSDRIYAGSAGGGIWRSEDAGGSWTPLTDHAASLGIGSSHAIAIDPNDSRTIYAGTTSFALLAQSLPRPIDFTQSKGVLKSTDDGSTWIVLGSGSPSWNNGNALQLFASTDINTIIVDPQNSSVLYLAAGRWGSVDIPGGLYRSTDGGENWTKSSSPAYDPIYAESLVLDPTSPPEARVLYAGTNGACDLGPAHGEGVLRSRNGGADWDLILSYDTPAVKSALPDGFSKAIVALSPRSDPANPQGQVVYVSLLDPGGNGKVLMSSNGWADSPAWVQLFAFVCTGDYSTLLGGPFSDMLLDPSPAADGLDHIYWGGASQFVSVDSGNCFFEIGEVNGIHGDHQTWLIVPNPSGPSVVYAGDDGGIWKSTDEGSHWTGTSVTGYSPPSINNGLQTAIVYALDVSLDGSDVIIAGTQDNGIVRRTAIPTAPNTYMWTGTSNDAMDVAFNRVAPYGVVFSVQNCWDGDCILKSTDFGADWEDITPRHILPTDQRGMFQNRLAIDPSRAGVLYVGGSSGAVCQTRNGGATFRSLGTPAPGMYVSSLDVAPSRSASLVIAANDWSSNNLVAVSTNVLSNSVAFQNITRNLPKRFVTRVAFDPHDPKAIYATLSGLNAQTPGRPGHVFRTTTGAKRWTDISPPADVPVNAIALDGTSSHTVLYIGTDQGVWRSDDGGTNWIRVDPEHLPNAAVSDLVWNPKTGVLTAATWGRGVFELSSPAGR